MSVRKRRFSITLTGPYLDRLNRLVREGLYMESQDVVREALRALFERQGIPLTPMEVSGW